MKYVMVVFECFFCHSLGRLFSSHPLDRNIDLREVHLMLLGIIGKHGVLV